MDGDQDKRALDSLLEFALQSGATRARRLSPASVCVENRLSAFCRDPKCPNWGQSMSCPPNVSGPEGFRKLLQSCRHAIVLRIEIQSSSLHGEDRPEVMRLLHEITAEVEMQAKRLGFNEAVGFAGGSCKPSFCHEHLGCRVITEQGKCRYPEHARTSLSGYGVNVGELMKSAGWSNNLFRSNSNDEEEEMSWVAGLVLLI
jgi:predicted metal-binding protein